jgi:hypothetical protein
MFVDVVSNRHDQLLDILKDTAPQSILREVYVETGCRFSHRGTLVRLNPKPFIWTAKANDILEEFKRARRSLNIVQSV